MADNKLIVEGTTNDFVYEFENIIVTKNLRVSSVSVLPSTEEQIITPIDENYAFNEIVVEPVTSEIDPNIVASNIRQGVTILGVEGNVEVDKPDQDKTAYPTTQQQIIRADTGYELASVTIEPVNPADYYKTEEVAQVTPSNAQQIITPSQPENVLSEVIVNPTPLETQEVTPQVYSQTIIPSGSSVGLESVIVQAVDNSIDANIIPSNIRAGVSILGVEGNCEPDKPDQTKTVTPTREQQIVMADIGYELAQVTINATPLDEQRSIIPTTEQQTILPTGSNIGLSGVVIEAVDPADYYKPEEVKTVTPTTEQQIITADDAEGVLSEVIVEATPLNSQTVTPTTTQQVITPSGTNLGLSSVTVEAVTSAIDPNILANNIRLGVSILGVAGNLEPDKPDQTKTATPTTSQQTIAPDAGYELASVTIEPVTSAIDENILAQNIVSGVTILGVAGTAIEQASGLPSAVSTQETLLATLESEMARVFDNVEQNGDELSINTTGASVTQEGTEITLD